MGPVSIPLQDTNYNIRSFTPDDAADIVKYGNNPNVAATLRDFFPHPYTETDAKLWLRYVRQQPVPTHFAIALETECIGTVGLFMQDDVNKLSAELGYWLGESFWGKGIATDVVSTFIRFAFKRYDIIRIYAHVFESNPVSAKVLEKCGFELEGRLRQSVIKNGKVMDQTVYSILKNKCIEEP